MLFFAPSGSVRLGKMTDKGIVSDKKIGMQGDIKPAFRKTFIIKKKDIIKVK